MYFCPYILDAPKGGGPVSVYVRDTRSALTKQTDLLIFGMKGGSHEFRRVEEPDFSGKFEIGFFGLFIVEDRPAMNTFLHFWKTKPATLPVILHKSTEKFVGKTRGADYSRKFQNWGF